MYLGGATSIKVGQRFDAAPATVLRWVRSHGGEVRPVGRVRVKPPPEPSPRRLQIRKREEIVKEQWGKSSVKELTARLGVSHQAIYQIARRVGITSRRAVSA